jgi:hypothetical protein
MALFDFLRKPKSGVPLPQICYDVAYFVLPHYAFNNVAKIVELCTHSPAAAGPFFYFLACQIRKIEPSADDAKRFQWHRGALDSERQFLALQYPAPPPIDLSAATPEQVGTPGTSVVLAPHYSAVIEDQRTKETGYFVLGQALFGGGTTLRCVERDGKNCNLGPGPEPQLDAFLHAVGAWIKD